MNYVRGDIIKLKSLAKIDLGAHVQNIKRPYVVISNNINNKKAPTLNIAAVSSHMEKNKYPMHVKIEKIDYKNLDKDSLIYAEQLLTIDKSYVYERIGHLNNKDLQNLNVALCIQVLGDENYEKSILSSACSLE